jgi:hypothetical protein
MTCLGDIGNLSVTVVSRWLGREDHHGRPDPTAPRSRAPAGRRRRPPEPEDRHPFAGPGDRPHHEHGGRVPPDPAGEVEGHADPIARAEHGGLRSRGAHAALRARRPRRASASRSRSTVRAGLRKPRSSTTGRSASGCTRTRAGARGSRARPARPARGRGRRRSGAPNTRPTTPRPRGSARGPRAGRRDGSGDPGRSGRRASRSGPTCRVAPVRPNFRATARGRLSGVTFSLLFCGPARSSPAGVASSRSAHVGSSAAPRQWTRRIEGRGARRRRRGIDEAPGAAAPAALALIAPPPRQ